MTNTEQIEIIAEGNSYIFFRYAGKKYWYDKISVQLEVFRDWKPKLKLIKNNELIIQLYGTRNAKKT